MPEIRTKKKLPIGVELFEKIIEDYYKIEKMSLTEKILDDAGVNLFTRPRRFGKALNVSMLKAAW